MNKCQEQADFSLSRVTFLELSLTYNVHFSLCLSYSLCPLISGCYIYSLSIFVFPLVFFCITLCFCYCMSHRFLSLSALLLFFLSDGTSVIHFSLLLFVSLFLSFPSVSQANHVVLHCCIRLAFCCLARLPSSH